MRYLLNIYFMYMLSIIFKSRAEHIRTSIQNIIIRARYYLNNFKRNSRCRIATKIHLLVPLLSLKIKQIIVINMIIACVFYRITFVHVEFTAQTSEITMLTRHDWRVIAWEMISHSEHERIEQCQLDEFYRSRIECK